MSIAKNWTRPPLTTMTMNQGSPRPLSILYTAEKWESQERPIYKVTFNSAKGHASLLASHSSLVHTLRLQGVQWHRIRSIAQRKGIIKRTELRLLVPTKDATIIEKKLVETSLRNINKGYQPRISLSCIHTTTKRLLHCQLIVQSPRSCTYTDPQEKGSPITLKKPVRNQESPTISNPQEAIGGPTTINKTLLSLRNSAVVSPALHSSSCVTEHQCTWSIKEDTCPSTPNISSSLAISTLFHCN